MNGLTMYIYVFKRPSLCTAVIRDKTTRYLSSAISSSTPVSSNCPTILSVNGALTDCRIFDRSKLMTRTPCKLRINFPSTSIFRKRRCDQILTLQRIQLKINRNNFNPFPLHLYIGNMELFLLALIHLLYILLKF